MNEKELTEIRANCLKARYEGVLSKTLREIFVLTTIPRLLNEVDRLRSELRHILSDTRDALDSQTPHQIQNWLRQIERRAVAALSKEGGE